MSDTVLGIDDLTPDGVRIVVPWAVLEVGDSVFIPCVNTSLAIRQVNRVAERNQIELRHSIMIEDTLLGVRFWRTT